MRYDIQKIIERLQKHNTDTIDDATLLELAIATHKINCIDSHIKTLEQIRNDPAEWMRYKFKDSDTEYYARYYGLVDKIMKGKYKINKSNVAFALGVKRPTVDKWIKDGVTNTYNEYGREKLIDLVELHETFLKIRSAKQRHDGCKTLH